MLGRLEVVPAGSHKPMTRVRLSLLQRKGIGWYMKMSIRRREFILGEGENQHDPL